MIAITTTSKTRATTRTVSVVICCASEPEYRTNPVRIATPVTLTLAFGLDTTSRHARHSVNKRDIVGKIALGANITRAQAARALEALLSGIQSSLASGD